MDTPTTGSKCCSAPRSNLGPSPPTSSARSSSANTENQPCRPPSSPTPPPPTPPSGNRKPLYRDLGTARQLWTPTRRDRYGDLDRPTALLELDRGHLDVAEQLATNSVRRWDGISHRARTHSTIVLATIHVRAGEANGLRLAHDAITAVGKLSSTRTRRYLQPLTDALSTRLESEARDLAHTARTVALSIP